MAAVKKTEEATRIELRSPDPTCNPYLTFSVILATELEGIEKEYPLPEPVEESFVGSCPSHFYPEQAHRMG